MVIAQSFTRCPELLSLPLPQYLAFTCGLLAGALTNLGIRCQVTAEVTTMPACELPHLPTIMPVHRAPFQIT